MPSVPANPRIMRLESIRRNEKTRHPAALMRTDQISDLVTGLKHTTHRMLTHHELVPNRLLLMVTHPTQVQIFNPVDPVRYPNRQCNRRAKTL